MTIDKTRILLTAIHLTKSFELLKITPSIETAIALKLAAYFATKQEVSPEEFNAILDNFILEAERES